MNKLHLNILVEMRNKFFKKRNKIYILVESSRVNMIYDF